MGEAFNKKHTFSTFSHEHNTRNCANTMCHIFNVWLLANILLIMYYQLNLTPSQII